MATPTLPPDPQLLTTYRYLRMALISVLVLLASAVLLAFADDGWPPLPSISDYYWTPVKSVFVGALVGLGVGMVVLKADNELEDIFLNVGGILAPVVAFVPVPELEGPPTLPPATVEAITNNITALLLAGALSLVVFAVLAFGVRGRRRDRRRLKRSIRLARFAGTGAVVALFLGGWWWFEHERGSFERYAHYAAAVTLFACIIAVTVLNAVSRSLASTASRPRSLVNAYSVLSALMALVLIAGLLLRDWYYTILFIEAGVLVLFLAFWIIQSAELWRTGVRHRGRGPSLLPRRPG